MGDVRAALAGELGHHQPGELGHAIPRGLLQRRPQALPEDVPVSRQVGLQRRQRDSGPAIGRAVGGDEHEALTAHEQGIKHFEGWRADALLS